MAVQPTNVRQVNTDPNDTRSNADPKKVASGAIGVSQDATSKGTALGLGVTEQATGIAGNVAGKAPTSGGGGRGGETIPRPGAAAEETR